MFETIIVRPIFNALMLIYSVIPGGDFGIAIVLFTIVIRFLMYPLVKRQLHQTKMMRKLQPHLAKIKKAANGNRQAEATQQMELYKRYGVSPFRSILILIVQLPIFIGLYQVIRIMAEHRDQMVQYIYEPLRHIGAIENILDNPDNFNHMFLGFIDITKSAFADGKVNVALLVLAVISAATQYVISKQTMPTTTKPKKKFRQIMAEAAAGQKADPSDMSTAMMGNMMKIMPFFMFFIMVSLPGALALYYTTSNLVAAGQQGYLLRKDTEELDELADEVIEKEDATITNKSTKPATKANQRQKNAKEAVITRIKAKE
ncbi:MAG: YidC/Oxa1 family membrane protein insertase [Candidatus Saccharimonas sp.]